MTTMPGSASGSADHYDQHAHACFLAGDLDGALGTLTEGIRRHPATASLFVGLGYTRLVRQEYAWAHQAFARAIGLEAGLRDAWLGYGQALLWVGRAEEGVAALDHAVYGSTAADIDVLVFVGRTLLRHGLPESATRYLSHALDLDAHNPDAATGGAVLLLAANEPDHAIALLGRALHTDPKHAEAAICLGHVLFDRHERDQAVECFTRIPPAAHGDPVSVARTVELLAERGAVDQLARWQARLDELRPAMSATDQLLAAIESRANGRDADPDGDAA